MRPPLSLVYLPLILCLLAGGYPLARRIAFDRANTKVLIAVDLGELTETCRAVGRPVTETFDRLRAMGVNGMVTTTYTPVNLVQMGLIAMEPAGPGLPQTRIKLLEPTDEFDVERRLKRLYAVDRSGDALLVHGAGGAVRDLRIFSSRSTEEAASTRGFTLLRRIPNLPHVGQRFLDLMIDTIGTGSWVLFDGKEALGYPAALVGVGKRLAGKDLHICNVEFAGQLGAREIAIRAKAESVLLHSVTVGEMERLSLSTLFPRWARAAQERGVRALLVRFFPGTNIPYPGLDVLEANMRYVKEVVGVLERAGYSPGPVLGPLDMWGTHGAQLPSSLLWLSRLASTMALASLLALLLVAAGLVPAPVAFAATAPLAVVLIAGYAGAPVLAAQSVALGIAVGAASLASILFDLSLDHLSALPWRARLAVIAWEVLKLAALALLGGLLVSMTLTSPSFVFRLEDFRGVKTVYLAPPLLAIGFHFWVRRVNPLDIRLRIRHVAVGLVIFAAGAVYLLRSGNFLSVGSPLMAEYTLRDRIEELGLIRPRTKEFLIGYPCLVAAGVAAALGDGVWRPLLLLAGCVAPVSAVNSFCHIHTPPMVSLARGLLAIPPGLFVGLIAVGFYLLLGAPAARPTLAVHGYLGFSNLGDDLILASFERLVRRHLPAAVECVIFTARPGPGAPGRREVARTSPLAYLTVLWRSTAMVSLGGGLFQDRTGPLTPLFYLAPVALARIMGMRCIVVIAQSFSSLKRPLLCAWVARVLAGVDLIVTRDRASLDNLVRWGGGPGAGRDAHAMDGARAQMLLGCDLLVAAPPDLPPRAAQRPRSIGLNLRPVPGMDPARQRALVGRVAAVARRTGHTLVLLSMQPDEDTPHLMSLASALEDVPAEIVPVSAEEPSKALAGVGVLVAMRYHGLLLGLLAGVPTLVLAYDAKVTDLFVAEGYPHVVDAIASRSDAVEAIEAALGRIMEGPACAVADGDRLVALMKGRGQDAIDRAMGLLASAFAPEENQRNILT